MADKLSSRGYATTRWTADVPPPFAELGFPPGPSGFSAAHYQPSKQPLSPQAQASLALLEDEYRNEAFGEEKPASVAGTETNQHLPFVMDAYGASRKSKLRAQVDPVVLQRAMAQAELAETLVVSPITSDAKVADPIVIHPDVVESVLGPAHDTVQADADTAEAEQAAQASQEQPALDTALTTSEPPALIAPIAPELPAVVGGIAPEEVAQREAEQFAKGAAQASEAAAVALAQAVAQATEQALAEGLAQGQTQGFSEGLQQGLAEGKAQGVSEGDAQARAEMTEEIAAHRTVFDNAASELGALLDEPKKFFEPLKRLAMHIAEQVVVGELQTSGKAIERLVQRCLDELDHPVHGAVVLELNAEDKARLQAQSGDFIKGMRLEAVPDMQPGSVRVFANDTVVEDLVEHRLEGLARALLIDVEAWRENSSLVQGGSQVDDQVEGEDVHS
jgi:flagellar biosynthesis/type III secretory pathway protein FliH